EIDHMLQRKIMSVRSVPASPTNVITHAVFWNALQGVVQCLDAYCGKLAVFLDTRSRHDHIVGVRNSRIIDLENEAGITNRPVFVFNSLGKSENVFVFGGIVFVVEEVLQPARGKDAHEGFFGSYISFGDR